MIFKSKVIFNHVFITELKRDFDYEDEGVAAVNDEEDDDFADLISAISLGGGGNVTGNFDMLDQSPKLLRSSSTPTKSRTRTKRGAPGTKSRNQVRRNSKGMTGYGVYGGEGILQLNAMKTFTSNISERISNLPGVNLIVINI